MRILYFLSIIILLNFSSLFANSADSTVVVNDSETVKSKNNLKINKPQDNVFINFGSGVQLYHGVYDKQVDISERLMRSFSLNIGKWITPEYGVRLGATGYKFKTFDSQLAINENKIDTKSFKQGYIHFDFLMNFSEILNPYIPHRKHSTILFAGAGLRRNFTTERSDYGLNYGLIQNFKLTNNVYLTFDFIGTGIYGYFNGNKRKQLLDHFISLNAGLTVNIGQNYWSDTQEKGALYTQPFLSDWFISIGAGGYVYNGDYDNKGKFLSERLGYGGAVALGKWFTPNVGARFVYEYIYYKGISISRGAGGQYLTGELSESGDYKLHIYASHPHVDMIFNITNLLCGYKEDRFYSCIPFIGAGYKLSKKVPAVSDIAIFTANFGINNTFRINSRIELFAEARLMSFDTFFNAIRSKNHKNDESYSVICGITYNFNARKWKSKK